MNLEENKHGKMSEKDRSSFFVIIKVAGLDWIASSRLEIFICVLS